MAKKPKYPKKPGAATTCHCVVEIQRFKGGTHQYFYCERSKNKAKALLKLMRKRFPASALKYKNAGKCNRLYLFSRTGRYG